jgi:cyclopropane-fatty-acyl-phospholipid synthase
MFQENVEGSSTDSENSVVNQTSEELIRNEESRLADYSKIIPQSFAHNDLLYLLSQYLHGERFAVSVGKQLCLDDRLTGDLQQAAGQFLEEEQRHVALLEDFFKELGTDPYPCHYKVQAIYQRLLADGPVELSLAALTCFVEPFGLGSIVGIRSSLLSSRLSKMLDVILEDEGRHLKLGPDWLKAMQFDFEDHLPVAQQLFEALTESTRAEVVFEEIWPLYWEKNLWMERAVHSKAHSKQSIRVLAAIYRQLARIPNGVKLRQGIETYLGIKPKALAPQHTAHPHYDDGNALFEDVIGPTMAYSSGVWKESCAKTLEEAQEAKFARIAKYSGIDSNSRNIADLGCGWGGYLSFLGRTYPNLESGVGLTISKEQAEWFARHNSDTRLSILQQSCFDYLDNAPEHIRFDAVSSIEALEHFAGPEDVRLGRHRDIYRHFFKSVAKRLNGKFGFETIVATKNISVMNKDEMRKAVRFALFMLRDVYPHSHLSSPSDIAYAAASCFRTLDFEVDHQDYSLTLQAWLKNLSVREDVDSDPRFALYKKYFEMCIEQFESGAIGIIRASFQTK